MWTATESGGLSDNSSLCFSDECENILIQLLRLLPPPTLSQSASYPFPVLFEEYLLSSSCSFLFLSLLLGLNEQPEGVKKNRELSRGFLTVSTRWLRSSLISSVSSGQRHRFSWKCIRFLCRASSWPSPRSLSNCCRTLLSLVSVASPAPVIAVCVVHN